MKSPLDFAISAETVNNPSVRQFTFVPSDQATIPCGVLKMRTRCFIDKKESSKYVTIMIKMIVSK
jgi:hypothetical protein